MTNQPLPTDSPEVRRLKEQNEQLRRMLRIMSIGIKALDEAIEESIEPEIPLPDQYDRG